jgi:hypothetical protein
MIVDPSGNPIRFNVVYRAAPSLPDTAAGAIFFKPNKAFRDIVHLFYEKRNGART